MSNSVSRKAVFLDRDGVLNRVFIRDGKPRSPIDPKDFAFYPGVSEAIERLKSAGFLLVVVTNQPDVARGWITREAVDAMNRIVLEQLKVDDLKACFHLEPEQCVCRKPKPGMLLEAAAQWMIDLKASFMVGDRYSDIQAGQTAGCRTVLIGDADCYGDEVFEPDHRTNSLKSAAEWIITLDALDCSID